MTVFPPPLLTCIQLDAATLESVVETEMRARPAPITYSKLRAATIVTAAENGMAGAGECAAAWLTLVLLPVASQRCLYLFFRCGSSRL